jgi:hypothetical protein
VYILRMLCALLLVKPLRGSTRPSCGWAISLKQIVSARVKTACGSRPRIPTDLDFRPDISSTFSFTHRQCRKFARNLP